MGLRVELPVCADAEHLILYVPYWFIWSSRDHEAGIMAWLYLPPFRILTPDQPTGLTEALSCIAVPFLPPAHPAPSLFPSQVFIPDKQLPQSLTSALLLKNTEIDHFNSILLTRVFHDLANNLHMNIRSKSQQFYSYKFQEETYRWHIYSSKGLDGWHKVT